MSESNRLTPGRPGALQVWAGFGIIGLILLWGGLAGGSLEYYLDIPSLIWVVGLLVGGLMVSSGFSVVAQAVAYALFRPWPIDDHTRGLYLMVFLRAYQLAWGAGLLGMLVNVMIMLQNMADPSRIGPGMAVSLLTVLYGALLAELVFAPMSHRLLCPDDRRELAIALTPQRSTQVMGFAVVFGVVACLFILLAGMSEIRNDVQYRAVVQQVQSTLGLPASEAADDDLEINVNLSERVEQMEAKSREDGQDDGGGDQDGRRRLEY